MWITLNKLLYAPLQYPKTNLDIHQGERLCGGLLPLVPQVSEKNSSRQLVNSDNPALKAHFFVPLFSKSLMRVYL